MNNPRGSLSYLAQQTPLSRVSQSFRLRALFTIMAVNVSSVPISTRALCGALCFVLLIIFFVKLSGFQQELATDPSRLLTFHDVLVPNFQLIPKSTFTHPWVLVTAIFAEISIFFFLVSFAVLFFASRYFETYWGFQEVIQYVVIVGSVTNLWTVLITIISNIFRSDVLGMNKPLGGGLPYYVAFLVAMKQLIPEHNLVLFQGILLVRVKQLAVIFMVLAFLWSLVTQSLYPFIPYMGAFLTAYLYLRFFQQSTADSILPIGGSSDTNVLIGDALDTFALVQFFPAQVRGYLSPVFDAIYEVSVLAGLVSPFNDEDIEQLNLRVQKRQQGQKLVANSVAERRRQVALQVIEDRINDNN